jgi:hypothetical protein
LLDKILQQIHQTNIHDKIQIIIHHSLSGIYSHCNCGSLQNAPGDMLWMELLTKLIQQAWYHPQMLDSPKDKIVLFSTNLYNINTFIIHIIRVEIVMICIHYTYNLLIVVFGGGISSEVNSPTFNEFTSVLEMHKRTTIK